MYSIFNMSSKELIISIYNSRKNVLEIMEQIGYNTDKYKTFSINELTLIPKQSDMMLESSTTSKIYIKYCLGEISDTIINNFVDELFEITFTLNKEKDTLYIISMNKPSETLLNVLKNIWDEKKILVVIEHIAQLQFNILKHYLIPALSILTLQEENEMLKQYYLTDKNKLPTISRFDPMSRAMCLRPGQILKCVRSSETAITSDFYRKCIEN